MYEKAKNVDERKIIKDLFAYGWNQKSDFVENSYKSLLAFLKKYFPAQKNLKLAEMERKRLV